jgi:cation:H+ antiporter
MAYMMLLVRSDTPADVDEVTEALREHQDDPLWKVAGLAVVGMVLLVVGAQLLVQGASSVARTFGISDRVIGVTVVALGTSLPELAATIAAAVKREGDIIVGNLVGSNIFNILSIIGIAAIVRPLVLPPEVANVDFWVMLVVSFITGGLLAWRARFGKLEGIGLVSIYGLYIAYIAIVQFG